MSNIRKITSILLTAAMTVSLASCANEPAKSEDDGEFNIVTSFYPMQILAMNVAGGIDGVTVECMSAPDIGCIHDHVFTTDDLRKVENADVYIENGLELETFNDRLLSAYPDLQVIEAAAEVTDAPEDDGEVNGHVWTSIDDYIIQIRTVSAALSEADPDHAADYEANAEAYIEKIEQLTESYAEQIAAVEGMRVLVIDETLPSFCVWLGLDYEVIETDHEQASLSAGDIADTVDWMNDNGVSVILVSSDSDDGIAEAVAAEINGSIVAFNTCMTGEVYADAYLDQMADNLVLLQYLG
jgi:zinc transport system substrate-binding protein